MVSTVTNVPNAALDDLAACNAWLTSIARHYGKEENAVLRQACQLAVQVHGQQTLDTGESRIHHLLSIADILAHLRMDYSTLATAILNGVLADEAVTEPDLEQRFGPDVARMLSDLARIGQIANVDAVIAEKDEHEHAENLRRLLLGIAEDVRVVLVVLAERLHLMRSIKNLDETHRRRIARDTQQIYAPLANRLGMWQIKWELEDLSLRYLEPEEYKRIASLLDGRRKDREAFIAQVIATLRQKLGELGIEAEISGRPKHIFSIWRKMQRKALDFDQIFDVRAVRVQVHDIADCYSALGVVHGLWKHIPGEFDDYIATPKANMYQSLHTAVIGPGDKPVEVQIRTFDMHRHAELGVAAHWRYKENKQHDAEFQRRVVWMRHWLELKNEGDGAEDFLEKFKSEFEPVHVYVLTPQSKVIELPRGATPLDFAYAIHSEVGHRCRGARVDGRIVPLHQPLASGQTVEILTAKNASPSRDWLSPRLGYLRTSRARNRVRQWFKHQDYEQHVAMGRASLDRELARLGATEKPDLDKIAGRYNLHKGDDVLAAIGRGDLSPIQIAGLVGERRPARPKERPHGIPRRRAQTRSEVVVEGVDNLLTHMARCCKPVPDDPIVGYLTRGRGVTIHRKDCPNVRHLDDGEQGRLIEVVWSEQPGDTAYPVDVFISAADRKGLLRDVSSVFTNEDINVTGVSSTTDHNTDVASMHFTVEIHSMNQLSGILHKVAQLPDVLQVRRRT